MTRQVRNIRGRTASLGRNQTMGADSSSWLLTSTSTKARFLQPTERATAPEARYLPTVLLWYAAVLPAPVPAGTSLQTRRLRRSEKDTGTAGLLFIGVII